MTDPGGAALSRPYEQLPAPDEGDVYITEVFDEQEYVSTGTFKPGTARKIENLTRIGCLVLDMDVKDWLQHTDKLSRDDASAAVHAATPEKMDEWLEALTKAFGRAWALTMPEAVLPTAAVISGCGLHVYLWLPDDQGRSKEDIRLARLLNKEVVKRLNVNAGFALADRSAVDAGTRILRPIGTFHTKNRNRPLPVRLLEPVRQEHRLDVRGLVDLWGLGVETRTPGTKQRSLRERLDIGEGGSGDDVLNRLFGSRVAALREMVATDLFFQHTSKHPEAVTYEMRRMQASNLLAAADTGNAEDAKTVFLELCVMAPDKGLPTNKRFDRDLMLQRFGQAVESREQGHGPLTFGNLKDKVEPAMWTAIFPPGTPHPPLKGSPAGEFVRRSQGRGDRSDSKKARARRNSDAFQTGRIEADTPIKGDGFDGTIGDWVEQAQVEGLVSLAVACPFSEGSEFSAKLALNPDGAAYLYCQVQGHDHVADGRIGWYVDLSGTWKPNAEVMIRLDRGQNGRPRPEVDNVFTILEGDHHLRERFWYDDFRKALMVGDRQMLDSDVTELRNHIKRTYLVHFSKDELWAGLEAVGKRYARNPVVDHFRSFAWDGTERLGEFLTKALGVPDGPLARTYSTRWLTGLAARVLDPGCKMDNVLVLVGGQGIGKSTAMRLLVGTEFFSDTPIDLRNKDAYQQVHEVIVYEFAELKGISSARVTQETIKAFFSSLVDRFRPPYKRTIEKHPRHTVFVATSNKPDILADPTGSRRYWAVTCAGTPDRHAWLADNREQLLAEAVARYDHWVSLTEGGQARLLHRGEKYQWWLTPEEELWRSAEADAFEQEDSRTHTIYEWAAKLGKEFTLGTLMLDLLGLDVEVQDRRLQMELSGILRHLGWNRQQRRRHGRRQWFWFPPADLTVPLSTPARTRPPAPAVVATTVGGHDEDDSK